MNCVECGKAIDTNVGTDENPLCHQCYNRIAREHAPQQPESNQKCKPIVSKRAASTLITLAVCVVILFALYSCLGLFVVQPIGAVPDGATVLYWRLGTSMPFISSADGIIDNDDKGVSLFGRGLALGVVAKFLEGRKLLTLPYSSGLYLVSTGGKVYESQNERPSGYTSSRQQNTGPTPADFEIVSYRGVWEGDRLRIKGEIRNNGSLPGGPKIEVVARDVNGELVDSEQFWPNSTTNIPPGGSCGIGYTVSSDRRARTVEARIIDVSVW